MITGIRTEVRIFLPLEKLRSALLTRGWPWLGREGLEGTREIELPRSMLRLKVVPGGSIALANRVVVYLEVHSLGVLHSSQIQGEITFQSNGSTTTAAFTGSAAVQAVRGLEGESMHRGALELASAVLKTIAHDVELGQLAGLTASQLPRPRPVFNPATGNNSNGGTP